MAKHEITMRSPRPVKHLLTDVALAAVRGIAFIEDPATPGKAKLADGSQPIAGMLTRDVVVGGPTLADAVYPGRTDLPVASGEQASFEHAEEFEAEGDALYSGTGQITSGASNGDEVSFLDGKPRLAQTGDYVEYELRDKAVTPETAGNLRCRFAVVQGHLKA